MEKMLIDYLKSNFNHFNDYENLRILDYNIYGSACKVTVMSDEYYRDEVTIDVWEMLVFIINKK